MPFLIINKYSVFIFQYWDVGFHQPVMVYRAIPEPVHVLRAYQSEILSGTNSNKFLVHPVPTGSPGTE